jgi:hypothetical protein
MSAFAALPLTFFAPLFLLILNRLNVRASLQWLAAFGIAAGTWVILLAAFWHLPQVWEWQAWGWAAEGGAVIPRLRLDAAGWGLAFALASVGLGVVLVIPSRPQEAGWRNAAGVLGLLSLGLGSVFAANLPALAGIWTALDILGLIILLRRAGGTRARLVIGFFANLAGTLLALGAASLPGGGGLLLVLAGGVRLGVLPVQAHSLRSLNLPAGVGALVRFAPAAGSLALLTSASIPEFWRGGVFALSALAGIFGAVNWLADQEAFPARYWMLGLGSLAVASAAAGLAGAVAVWGAGMLLGGGALALGSPGARGFRIYAAVFAVTLAGLPYSPAWAGGLVFSETGWWGVPFGVTAALMLAGLLRRGAAAGETAPAASPGARLPGWLGLAVILGGYLLAGWLPRPAARGGWWEGAALLGLTLLIGYARRRGVRFPAWTHAWFNRIFDLGWLYRIIWRGYRLLGRAVGLISRALEGEGSLLWALVLLAALASLFGGGQ